MCNFTFTTWPVFYLWSFLEIRYLFRIYSYIVRVPQCLHIIHRKSGTASHFPHLKPDFEFFGSRNAKLSISENHSLHRWLTSYFVSLQFNGWSLAFLRKSGAGTPFSCFNPDVQFSSLGSPTSDSSTIHIRSIDWHVHWFLAVDLQLFRENLVRSINYLASDRVPNFHR